MDVLDVFAVFVGGKSVHLDSEGHALLPAMFSGGELSADAVDLERHQGLEVGRLRVSSRVRAKSSGTWMKTEAFLAGSQRNSMVLRCRGCEQGSIIPTDNGISANNESVRLNLQRIFPLVASGDD